MDKIVKSTYSKGVLSIQNVWFADISTVNDLMRTAQKDKCDIVNYHGINLEGILPGWREQYSIMSDLREDEERLFDKIRKNYRYEIRRAEKEEVEIRKFIGSEMLKESKLLDVFEQTYNQMYRDKNMKTIFNRPQVEQYLRDGSMVVTIGFSENIPYVFHSYIYNDVNARFFYSTSPFRNDKDDAALIGRINKAVHWHDMKMFKAMGVVNYDWGGVSDKNASNGIDRFKVGFGGEVIKYYNCSVGVSIKGKAIIKIWGLFNR